MGSSSTYLFDNLLDYCMAANQRGFRNCRGTLIFPSPGTAVKGYREYVERKTAEAKKKKEDTSDISKQLPNLEVSDVAPVTTKPIERGGRKKGSVKSIKKYDNIASMTAAVKDNNNNPDAADLTQLTPKEIERLVLYNANADMRYLDETYSNIKEVKNVSFNSDPWKMVILGT